MKELTLHNLIDSKTDKPVVVAPNDVNFKVSRAWARAYGLAVAKIINDVCEDSH
jgi:hypothetical protein